MSGEAALNARVVDAPERERFEILVDDRLAGFLRYRRHPGLIELVHTEVPDEYEGQGIGGALVRGALDAVRNEGLAVLPLCPFANAWIARHPEYVDLVPPERRERFGL